LIETLQPEVKRRGTWAWSFQGCRSVEFVDVNTGYCGWR